MPLLRSHEAHPSAAGVPHSNRRAAKTRRIGSKSKNAQFVVLVCFCLKSEFGFQRENDHVLTLLVDVSDLVLWHDGTP